MVKAWETANQYEKPISSEQILQIRRQRKPNPMSSISASQTKWLTVEDLNETAARIELRTANMVCVEPVCAECKQRVIDCYDSGPHTESLVCWDAVGHATCTEQKAPLGNHARDPMVAPMPSFCAFTKCVQTAAAKRLHARTQRDAREHARRERHVAHAREHALKDLTPPAPQETTA
ncbi:unnamed protein product [Parnassius apollo]|uniref:(apollo) hypothetical protein n=1 Tax=Parnassius apollo TaxID=110799 RepID=A0A8S3XYS3_PARAO|nr:unnamed protein product [Parnassius apollo]